MIINNVNNSCDEAHALLGLVTPGITVALALNALISMHRSLGSFPPDWLCRVERLPLKAHREDSCS